MYRDPRGGHNRKQVNESFFKIWSPQMAYVLGLIFADGAVEDVRKSSRTCYVQLSNNDKSLLNEVKACLSSTHVLSWRNPRRLIFRGKSFYCAKSYSLQIGNRAMYQDLLDLGVTPRKSLTMMFPDVPSEHLSFFVRGYFDGDGCINLSFPKQAKTPRLQLIFTSGSMRFLETLMNRLSLALGISIKNIYHNERAYRLRYKKWDSMKILDFMYRNLREAPYMDRKYQAYKKLFVN